MGFEDDTNNGIHVDDVKLALMGHVKEHYEFTPGKQLMKDDEGYNSCPTLDDKVHVLLSVVPVSSISILSERVLKKMREVRLAASEMGIPQLTVLTKVDEACPKAKKNLKDVYVSEYLKEMVEKFSMLVGIPVNCIFLVKNYNSEVQINDQINAQILCALRQIVTFGEDYLNNL
ncbi:Interferon-induced protein 44 Microtubule-associated protein 44 [Channa argus]|uniref:Interferon-induced protein 44 Microtubule-associated protein 44 n=2 Tax=Channa argus TaxID=215402 RepID=A0A6G1QDT5_CHAAH|nr:Interferon-induced protein 44 Microtubule-associated protein 44 [Channa argus]